MTTRIESDYTDVVRELDRVEGLMESDQRGRRHLELVLDIGFEETQARVHIDTHSLKTSGRVDSKVENGVWEGEISYGGASPGSINDPVRYARYEQNRGGEHDWMAGLPGLHAFYIEAIRDVLAGR